MKRRESVLSSSSSRRETAPENHQAKSVGCMSGIFQLVCKYQQRRKFLTSARKQEKNDDNGNLSPVKPKPTTENNEAAVTAIGRNGKEGEAVQTLGKNPTSACDFRRFSCDVPRSPTLPAEIRRSNSVNSPEDYRRPHPVVARLMGLDEIPASPSPESAAEKRRKLLGALEKCDEDLQTLKKIIEAIRSADQMPSSPAVDNAGVKCPRSSPGSRSISKQSAEGDVSLKSRASSGSKRSLRVDSNGVDWRMKERCSEFSSEQPSPVSVLDDISSSPLISCERRGQRHGELKKAREENISMSFQRVTLESLPKLASRKGDYPCQYFESTVKKSEQTLSSPFGSSKAMIQSVNEVSKDMEWGEGRELVRVGLVLQDNIFGDLIEEVVREMGLRMHPSLLPFEACRRRLCF
ncbi:PREDICTED: uncharacterized protein LOC104593538 [Nelumbo nucifera]|uniref:DUF3741 domain-containing protein n=2 Tax=Nelumbo nucifera TaxID=4432 RepID=A0A822ZID7_NELNU|nr:PREDICTED: uncharacterized protein LOC104593538 [Nelumbo nucifera]DAD43129.1 TPA_asm: hypothetical protein HUJ06_001359 [Nelumbo nucifera]